MGKLFFYLSILLVFNSCETERKDLIVGKWDSYLDANDPLNYAPHWENWRFIFYKDGTGTLQTFEKKGELSDPRNFNYRLIHDGKKIQINYENLNPSTSRITSEEWDIVKLNETKFEIITMKVLKMKFRKAH